MCEIYAYSGEVNKTFNDELREFFSHCTEHPNGWGLAVEEDGRMNLEKEAVQASESRYLRERLRLHLEGTAALAHIRYATIGSVKHANCHPFMGKDRSGRWWTLVHNGTIFDYAPMDHYTRVQTGSTDSERILLYLIDIMNAAAEEKGRVLTARERFELLDSVFALMSKNNKLNIVLYDGELLYVHARGTSLRARERAGLPVRAAGRETGDVQHTASHERQVEAGAIHAAGRLEKGRKGV